MSHRSNWIESDWSAHNGINWIQLNETEWISCQQRIIEWKEAHRLAVTNRTMINRTRWKDTSGNRLTADRKHRNSFVLLHALFHSIPFSRIELTLCWGDVVESLTILADSSEIPRRRYFDPLGLLITSRSCFGIPGYALSGFLTCAPMLRRSLPKLVDRRWILCHSSTVLPICWCSFLQILCVEEGGALANHNHIWVEFFAPVGTLRNCHHDTLEWQLFTPPLFGWFN